MTLPEELVSAVVQSIVAERPDESPNDLEEAAQVAVAAVLRALPECEAVIAACRGSINATNTIAALTKLADG